MVVTKEYYNEHQRAEGGTELTRSMTCSQSPEGPEKDRM